MGDGVFSECTSLEGVLMDNTLSLLGNRMFSGCTALKEVTVPPGVTCLNDSIFIGCTALSAVYLKDGLENIGARAFAGCSSLASIKLPSTLKEIGFCAFGESGLATIYLGVSRYFALGEDGYLYNKGRTTLMLVPPATTAKEVVLPDELQSIADCAFYGCRHIERLEVPESLYRIGDYAFAYCVGLREMEFSTESAPRCGKEVLKGVDVGKISLDVPSSAVSAFKMSEPFRKTHFAD